MMMTAVAVTVARTLERVVLLRDRAAAVVIRYTMTPKTIENVRAICAEETGEGGNYRAGKHISRQLLNTYPLFTPATRKPFYWVGNKGPAGPLQSR